MFPGNAIYEECVCRGTPSIGIITNSGLISHHNLGHYLLWFQKMAYLCKHIFHICITLSRGVWYELGIKVIVILKMGWMAANSHQENNKLSFAITLHSFLFRKNQIGSTRVTKNYIVIVLGYTGMILELEHRRFVRALSGLRRFTLHLSTKE